MLLVTRVSSSNSASEPVTPPCTSPQSSGEEHLRRSSLPSLLSPFRQDRKSNTQLATSPAPTTSSRSTRWLLSRKSEQDVRNQETRTASLSSHSAASLLSDKSSVTESEEDLQSSTPYDRGLHAEGKFETDMENETRRRSSESERRWRIDTELAMQKSRYEM
jgi:hypothetical protein